MATYLGQPGVEADSDPTEVVATDVLPEKGTPQTPPGRVTPGSVLHSHWSRSDDARISLVESFIVLLGPAILCHKEPALASKYPKGAPRWFFMTKG